MADVRSEVVDFIFDQGRAATERQLRDADALDAKATQAFSAATVIVGLSSFSQEINAALLTAAVVVYLVARSRRRVVAMACEVPRDQLARAAAAPVLERALESDEVRDVTDMAAGFNENEHALGRKRGGVLAALRSPRWRPP